MLRKIDAYFVTSFEWYLLQQCIQKDKDIGGLGEYVVSQYSSEKSIQSLYKSQILRAKGARYIDGNCVCVSSHEDTRAAKMHRYFLFFITDKLKYGVISEFSFQ